jgi:predicted lipoprotein with Yx(FWY)xxD motif
MIGASHWWAGAALGALVLVAAACSSGSSSPTTTQTTPTTTSTAGTSRAATVRLARVGSVGTVLVNASGMTLYHFTHDSTGQSTCTGACTSLWPPLLVPAGTAPTGTGLSAGAFGTITRADGTTQVTYNGMPLYTYSGDKSAGSANGQNVAGSWFVITSSSSSGGGTPSGGGATTTTKASGGYGY